MRIEDDPILARVVGPCDPIALLRGPDAPRDDGLAEAARIVAEIAEGEQGCCKELCQFVAGRLRERG